MINVIAVIVITMLLPVVTVKKNYQKLLSQVGLVINYNMTGAINLCLNKTSKIKLKWTVHVDFFVFLTHLALFLYKLKAIKVGK